MAQQRAAGIGRLRAEEDAYRQAFGRFLSGTDEKTVTHAYLDRVVSTLAARRVFLDIGPAEGTTTRHLAASFERTVCIEPSEPMRRALRRACPDAVVLPDPVLTAEPGVTADLVLLSHVLYYIPRGQWLPTLRRAWEWVAPGGLLLVLLQNADNACMTMVRHFTGCRFDLRELAREFAEAPSGEPARAVRMDTVPARYSSPDLDETVAVAGFHLSVPPGSTGRPPTRGAVEEYVRRHFETPDGGYAIRHDQDALCVRRPRP